MPDRDKTSENTILAATRAAARVGVNHGQSDHLETATRVEDGILRQRNDVEQARANLLVPALGKRDSRRIACRHRVLHGSRSTIYGEHDNIKCIPELPQSGPSAKIGGPVQPVDNLRAS